MHIVFERERMKKKQHAVCNRVGRIHKLTVITSRGSIYNADKLIESNSFELNRPRCIMQISSLIPLRWIFVMVRLKINLGIEYNADVIQTPAITICSVSKSTDAPNKKKMRNKIVMRMVRHFVNKMITIVNLSESRIFHNIFGEWQKYFHAS